MYYEAKKIWVDDARWWRKGRGARASHDSSVRCVIITDDIIGATCPSSPCTVQRCARCSTHATVRRRVFYHFHDESQKDRTRARLLSRGGPPKTLRSCEALTKFLSCLRKPSSALLCSALLLSCTLVHFGVALRGRILSRAPRPRSARILIPDHPPPPKLLSRHACMLPIAARPASSAFRIPLIGSCRPPITQAVYPFLACESIYGVRHPATLPVSSLALTRLPVCLCLATLRLLALPALAFASFCSTMHAFLAALLAASVLRGAHASPISVTTRLSSLIGAHPMVHSPCKLLITGQPSQTPHPRYLTRRLRHRRRC
jgi:hypothetical protein